MRRPADVVLDMDAVREYPHSWRRFVLGQAVIPIGWLAIIGFAFREGDMGATGMAFGLLLAVFMALPVATAVIVRDEVGADAA